MVYNFNGMNIAIPDDILENYMNNLDLSQDEAIQLYLEDNEYQKNEEQQALNEKARAMKVSTLLGAGNDKPRQRTPSEKTRKVDEVKHNLVEKLVEFLGENGANDIKIKTVDKLIVFNIGEDEYKLDLIKTRKKKD